MCEHLTIVFSRAQKAAIRIENGVPHGAGAPPRLRARWTGLPVPFTGP
jgi:hypothetical protein